MRKNLCLLMITALTGSFLTSCNISLKGNADDYFEVTFYTDFEGMDPNNPATFQDVSLISKSKYAGKGYFLKKYANLPSKEQESISPVKISDRTGVESGLDPYVSTIGNTKEYRRVFSDFVGYYADGKPVILNNITDNCNVYANFNLEKMEYLLRVFTSANKLLFGGSVPYGSYVRDYVTDIPRNPDHDPDKNIDAYFMKYEYLGYQGTMYDENNNEILTPVMSIDQVLSQKVTDKITYKPVYDNGHYRDYKVTFTDENNNLLEERFYVWGNKIDNSDLHFNIPECTRPNSSPDLKWVFDKWVGTYEVDDDTDPRVVSALYRAGLYGGVVDFSQNYVRYDCVVYPKYKEVKKEVILKFHTNLTGSEIVTRVVDYGQEKIVAPTVNDEGEYSFTGLWKDVQGNVIDLATFNPIEDMELFAQFVKSEVVLTYDAPWQGITFHISGTFKLNKSCLVSIDDEGTKHFAPGYQLVAVENVASGYTGDYAVDINKFEGLELPIYEVNITDASLIMDLILSPSVTALSVNSCRNTQISSLDLTNTNLVSIDSLAFSYSSKLTSLSLPSTIRSLGKGIVQGCENLTSLYVDMTDDDFNAIRAKGLISEKWNYVSNTIIADVRFK